MKYYFLAIVVFIFGINSVLAQHLVDSVTLNLLEQVDVSYPNSEKIYGSLRIEKNKRIVSDCDFDTLVYTTPNIIPDNTHNKISDWILFPDQNVTIEVKNGTNVSFIAGDSIEIKTNFEVEAGAEFLLDIEDCGPEECTTYFNNLLGGDKIDKIHSMEVTNDGGYILAGSSSSSNNGDIVDTITGAPASDYWIVKLDAKAAIEWSRLYGGSSSDNAHSIIQTADGGYVVSGDYGIRLVTIKLNAIGSEIWRHTYNDMDFVHFMDIMETSTGDLVIVNNMGLLYKLNSGGTLEWEKEISDNSTSVSETLNGNYVVNGYSNDIILTEFDVNGNTIGTATYGTDSDDYTLDFYPTNDGGYIIGGSTKIIDGNSDYLIIKVANDGTQEWEKIYGGEGNEAIWSIIQTDDGGYAATGWSKSSNSGDVTKINNGGSDFWIVKLDASGNIEWENLIGSSENETPISIRQTFDGGYVLVGNTKGNAADGDIIDESNGSTDAWFVKLDPNGELVQTTPCDTPPPVIPEPVDSTACGLFNNLLGGDQIDKIYSMEVTNDGGYILAGTSTSSNNGDIVNANAGGEDFWIVKLDANAKIEWSKLLGDDSYNTAYSIIQTADGNYVVNGTDGLKLKTIKLDLTGNEMWSTIYDRGSNYSYARTDIIETSTGDFIGTGYALKTVPNAIEYSGFVFKLNAGGSIEWENEISYRNFSVVEAANGNYIINGFTSAYGIFGSTDIVSTEFDHNGNVVSRKSYGTSSGELAQEIYSTNDGGYIIGGTIDENGNYNYLIIKVAADGTEEWQKIYGGDGREYLYSIAQTDDNGYILGGYSESSNNGDIVKTNNGGRDFWIVKLDASGSLEWENLVGGSADDIPRSARQATDGGYVIAGYTESTISGDIIDGSNGDADGWFLKLDVNGEIEEITPCTPIPIDSTTCEVDILNSLYGGTGADYIEYMEVSSEGGYITAGYTASSQSGDITDVNVGANDFWVMKLSENGSTEWSKLYGYNSQDKAYSLRQTTDGGYVIAGSSYQTNLANYVGIVLKLDSQGEQVWETQISPNTLNLTLREVIETKDGGYITIGNLSDKTSSVTKLDADGNISWTQTYPISLGLSIDQADNGNYYLSGLDDNFSNGGEDDIWIAYLSEDGTNLLWQQFYGVNTADDRCLDGVVSTNGGFVAGCSTEQSGNYDYQIFEVDATGNIIWETVLGGDGRDVVTSIEQTSDGGYIVGGSSSSSNSGDIDLTNNGAKDFWIVKLNSIGDVEWKNLIGGNADDDLKSIHQTVDGGYITAGNSLSSNEGDVKGVSNGNRDVWFVKLNTNGEIESNSCASKTSSTAIEEQAEEHN